MRNRCRRSERGDVGLEPVLLVLGTALALTMRTGKEAERRLTRESAGRR